MRIAAVSTDPEERMQLARAFDEAPATWVVSLHEEVPDEVDLIVCGPAGAVEGAVTVDPASPKETIAEVARRSAARTTGKRIFVTGATGGSGATSVALHLAATARGCIVETHGPGVRRRLGMHSARAWSSDGDSKLADGALPVAPGFKALLAPQSATTEDVKSVLQRASETFSTVVVDCLAADLDRLAAPGDLCVLVMLPTRPAAERAKEILELNGPRWAVVTNRPGPGGCLTRRRLEAKLDHRVAIELPCSAALRDAEDDGTLVTSPFSPWLWKLKKLWRALETA